jgi:hypothetical protein
MRPRTSRLALSGSLERLFGSGYRQSESTLGTGWDVRRQSWHRVERRELKKGRPTPDGFRQEGGVDPVTGKRVGWVLCNRDEPTDRWHWEAYDRAAPDLAPGTYELVGPKVQGNPHDTRNHVLIPHGNGPDLDPPTEFDALGAWLHHVATDTAQPGFEGIVWHHPDGRMAKIKTRDFPG